MQSAMISHISQPGSQSHPSFSHCGDASPGAALAAAAPHATHATTAGDTAGGVKEIRDNQIGE